MKQIFKFAAFVCGMLIANSSVGQDIYDLATFTHGGVTYTRCRDRNKSESTNMGAKVNGKLVVPCKYYFIYGVGGHLFAYPPGDPWTPYDECPAAVYTPDGKLLFSVSDGILDAKQEGGKTLFKDKYGNWKEAPGAIVSSSRSSSSNSSGVLYQGMYYMSGNGTDNASSREMYIEIYEDHIVASGVYCEYANSEEWARKNNRMKGLGYDYRAYYVQGMLTEEFLLVDYETFEVELIVRQQNPYGGHPSLYRFPFTKTGGGNQYQYQYQYSHPQYQQQYQQPQNQQESQQQNQNNRSTTTQTRHQCTHCGGKGWVVKEDSGVGFGLGDKRYCSKCGKDMFPHSHPPCGICNGKGWY